MAEQIKISFFETLNDKKLTLIYEWNVKCIKRFHVIYFPFYLCFLLKKEKIKRKTTIFAPILYFQDFMQNSVAK